MQAMQPTLARAQEHPVREQLLIAELDWERFFNFSKGRDCEAVFKSLDTFYRLVEQQVTASGGLVIKFIGDAALVVYHADDADRGINTLLDLRHEVDSWLAHEGIDSRLQVSCHVGEAMIGPMGGPATRRVDVIGEAVNIAFTLGHRGFVLSPQAFRSLGAETRKRFHKFTPPVVYLAE